jgi:hypothetical protein
MACIFNDNNWSALAYKLIWFDKGFNKTEKMKGIFSILLTATLTTLLTSCDPVYPITITNDTTDTIKFEVKENYRFNSEQLPQSKTKDGFTIYQILPKDTMEIGSAIAEIDNDMPIEEIRIFKPKDTISANNLIDIKKLFDKKFFGGLKTPYNLTIK